MVICATFRDEYQGCKWSCAVVLIVQESLLSLFTARCVCNHLNPLLVLYVVCLCVYCAQAPLNERIAKFYDASSGLWEDMWGEHMHHGGS